MRLHFHSPKKDIKPLPYPYYLMTIFLLAFTGLADSVYLFASHYLVYTNISYESFCAFTKAINCDTVSQNKYSIFWGLPLAIWGILGYTGFLVLASFALDVKNEGKHIWNLLPAVALLYCLHSLSLAYLSIYVIHSYCIMCILSYIVNFFLLFFSWLTRKRFEKAGVIAGTLNAFRFLARKWKLVVPAYAFLLLAVILIKMYLPEYWKIQLPPLPDDIHHGVTSDGHPWIGGENPELVIVEFTDYYCFQCRKTHDLLRRILAKHPDKIRIVHRNFPMDQEFNPLLREPLHVGSGKIALISIGASEMDNFWKINDFLYLYSEQKSFDIRELAEKTGTDPLVLAAATRAPYMRHKLKREIAEGIELGLTGTPSFLVNGVLHSSQIPPEIIEKYWK